MNTPASLGFNPSQQLGAPGTGMRATSTQPTPLTRPDLGYGGYVGFRQPVSQGRRSSLAPSVSQPARKAGHAAGRRQRGRHA